MPNGWSPIWLFAVVGVMAALWLCDRALLWMEDRGWIYYRRLRGGPSRAGASQAFLEMQTMLEPEKRYVLVLKKEEKTLRDDQGAPPPDGPPGDAAR